MVIRFEHGIQIHHPLQSEQTCLTHFTFRINIHIFTFNEISN